MWLLPVSIQLIPSRLLHRKQIFRLTYFKCEGVFPELGVKKAFPAVLAVVGVVIPMIIVSVAIIWLLW